jgi:hypothetical protein
MHLPDKCNQNKLEWFWFSEQMEKSYKYYDKTCCVCSICRINYKASESFCNYYFDKKEANIIFLVSGNLNFYNTYCDICIFTKRFENTYDEELQNQIKNVISTLKKHDFNKKI